MVSTWLGECLVCVCVFRIPQVTMRERCFGDGERAVAWVRLHTGLDCLTSCPEHCVA